MRGLATGGCARVSSRRFMGTRLTRARKLWVTAAFLTLLVGLLASQVIATCDAPDDGYVGGFWDDSDEDTLLLLVRDHTCGLLPEIALCSGISTGLHAARYAAHFVDFVPHSSFD